MKNISKIFKQTQLDEPPSQKIFTYGQQQITTCTKVTKKSNQQVILKYIPSTYTTDDSDTPITRIMSAYTTGYSDTYI
jgi:hypothetical protein